MDFSKNLDKAYQFAINMAAGMRLQFMTPELLLVSMYYNSKEFKGLCNSYHVNFESDLKEPIYAQIGSDNMVPEDFDEYELKISSHLDAVIYASEEIATNAHRKEVNFPHVLHAMLKLNDSQANYLLRTCFTEDEEELLRYVSEMDGYLYTDFTDVLQQANKGTFALYSLGVYILIAFSVCLGLLIIYNTTQTNLFEQKRELSVLRSLGFQIREISGIWLIQTTVQFLFACALGLPLGVVMAKYSLAQMSMDSREYPFVNDPMQFVITVCLVLAYILISHYAAMRNIRKWDIVENIKEKE